MNPLSKALNKWLRTDGEDLTEDEIISMVNESSDHGNIQESEAEMIHNIFELDDTQSMDIMTRRNNIVAIEGDTLFEDALDYMLDQSFSRFPVYQEDIDHILGIIHIKDAMVYSRKKDHVNVEISKLPQLMSDAIFVPETQSINTLFKTMQTQKRHLVIVVDEYGQTSGIVAMEDILEEIVGNIQDEHDHEQAMIIKRNDNSYLLNGMADLEEVGEALSIDIEAQDIDTLNGLLISLIDKIPEDNDRFEVHFMGYTFRILSVYNKTIRTVLAIKDKE